MLEGSTAGTAWPGQAGRVGVKGFALTLQQHAITMFEQTVIAKFLLSRSLHLPEKLPFRKKFK